MCPPRHNKGYTIVTAVFKAITEALQRGEAVTIRGFGTFTPYTRQAHKSIQAFRYDGGPFLTNLPRTIEIVPEKTRIIFKPSKALIKYINASQS